VNGGWRIAVFAVHAGILAIAWYVNRSTSFRLRLGALTGYPAGVERGLLGSIAAGNRRSPQRPASSGAAAPAKRPTLVEERMTTAANRVASGWSDTVHHRMRSTPSASELLMIWSDGVTGVVRIAALRALPDGSGEIWGLLFSGSDQNVPIRRSRVQRWEALPEEDELTLALRMQMERIARWPIPADASQVTG
jgi:hypothetical protein